MNLRFLALLAFASLILRPTPSNATLDIAQTEIPPGCIGGVHSDEVSQGQRQKIVQYTCESTIDGIFEKKEYEKVTVYYHDARFSSDSRDDPKQGVDYIANGYVERVSINVTREKEGAQIYNDKYHSVIQNTWDNYYDGDSRYRYNFTEGSEGEQNSGRSDFFLWNGDYELDIEDRYDTGGFLIAMSEVQRERKYNESGIRRTQSYNELTQKLHEAAGQGIFTSTARDLIGVVFDETIEYDTAIGLPWESVEDAVDEGNDPEPGLGEVDEQSEDASESLDQELAPAEPL